MLAIILLIIGVTSFITLVFFPIFMLKNEYGFTLSTLNDYYLGKTYITMDEAEQIAFTYLESLKSLNRNLAIKEIMEFEYNFYIIYFEEDTGIGAFEMLIWKTNAVNNMMMRHMGWTTAGKITPEPGPNMMWNLKYGHMNRMMRWQYNNALTIDMPISEEEAKSIGQRYLNQYFPGSTIMETTKFYGYYTFDFGKDDKIYGMFSVNGYTGQVWYHSWHGAFINMREYEEHEEHEW